MKKFKFLLFAAIAAAISVTLPACSDDDDDNIGTEKDLIGTWTPQRERGWQKDKKGKTLDSWDVEYEDEYGGTYKLEVYEDGTWKWYRMWRGSWSVDSYGSWEKKDGTFIFEHLSSRSPHFLYDNTPGKVSKLNSSTLEIESHYIKSDAEYNEDTDSYEDKFWTTFSKVLDEED